MNMTPSERRLAAAMTEDGLQEHVRKLITDLGLEAQHIRDARRCWMPGWPDLTIFGAGSILFAELKSQHGSLSPEQRHVASLIRVAGGRWVLWRPANLLSGEIARTLAGMAAWPELPLNLPA